MHGVRGTQAVHGVAMRRAACGFLPSSAPGLVRSLVRMKLHHWGMVAVLVGCGGYLRPPKPDQKAVFTAEVIRFESSNGFRFIVLPDENASVVRFDVRYHVGAMNDPAGREGMAHLVEHMLFHTRIKTSGGELSASQILTGTAQWSNATTDLDTTHYMIQTAPEHLGTAFMLEVARLRLGCSTWDEATFVREREIVRNEIRGHHVEAWGDLPRILHEEAYPAGHPYRRTTGGTDASIAAITLQDACAFVDKYYRPGNLTIIASGKTTEAEIKRLASEHLTTFPPTEMMPPPKVARAPRGNGYSVTRELDIDEPTLVALFPIPAQGTRERRLVDIARGGIAQSINNLAIKAEWGDGAWVDVIGGARAPLLAVSVSLRDLDDLGAARRAIGTAMRFAVNETRYIDNERWRTPVWLYYKEALIDSFESFGRRPMLFGDYEQFDDEWLYLIGRLRELDTIRSDDIHEAGKQWLNPDAGTYVLLRPKKGARGGGAGNFAYRASAHDPSSWRFPVDLAEADRPLQLPRDRRPRLGVVERTLDNGLRILMWPHSTTPMTYGRLVIQAGNADEPRGHGGLADIVGGQVGLDTTQTSWRELSVDMDLAVEALSLALRHRATQNLDKWRERMTKELSLPHVRQRAEYDDAFRAALYGAEHPYGHGILTPATLKNIDGEDASDFERKYHTAGNSTLILTGMFDPELAVKHARYQFGHLASKKRGARNFPAVTPRTRREIVKVHGDDESPVVAIDVAFVAAAGIDRSYAARTILAQVIDARLSALREGIAVTYGMHAGHVNRHGPGEWRIAGQIDAARAAEGIAHLQLVLDELRGDPAVWKGDFVIARRKAVDALLSTVTSSSVAASELATIASYDLPLDFYDRLIDDLANVRPEDLQRIIAAELSRDQEVIGLFGPAKAVAAAEAALYATAR